MILCISVFFKSIEDICTYNLDYPYYDSSYSIDGALCYTDLVCGFTNKELVEAGASCGSHTDSLDNIFGGHQGYWYDYLDTSWPSMNYDWSSYWSSYGWDSYWSSYGWGSDWATFDQEPDSVDDRDKCAMANYAKLAESTAGNSSYFPIPQWIITGT